MKKKLVVLGVSSLILLSSVAPVFAATDPNVSTNAYIDYVVGSSTLIKGKAYAITTNPNMTQLNVAGAYYQNNVKKESGSGSTTKKGTYAEWYSGNYSATVPATVEAASRTYYNGGSYDQDYASYTW